MYNTNSGMLQCSLSRLIVDQMISSLGIKCAKGHSPLLLVQEEGVVVNFAY